MRAVVACAVRTICDSFHNRLRLNVPILMMSRRVMKVHFRFLTFDLRLLLTIIFIIVGCGERVVREPIRLSTEAWQGGGRTGQRIHSTHYTINTTVEDEEFNQRLAEVMEGAWNQYTRMSGITPPLNARPMDCYMFATRAQWAQF